MGPERGHRGGDFGEAVREIPPVVAPEPLQRCQRATRRAEELIAMADTRSARGIALIDLHRLHFDHDQPLPRCATGP